MSHPALDQLKRDDRYRDLGLNPRFVVDLRYNTANNFVGRDLYGDFDRAFLHVDAADKLEAADAALARRAPGHRFVIFDALRPRSVQRLLWAAVVGTPDQVFIADPDLGSLHNYGFAVDLSIVDPTGRPIDVGAGFDDFREVAQPRHEAACLERGDVTVEQLANRHLLRDVMVGAGFTQLAHEWWHFDALTRAEARARHRIVE